MHIEIITPDATLFTGDATAVSLPGAEGRFQVLNNHAPLIASLSKGDVVVENAAGKQNFTITGGLVEVLKNKVIILA